MTIGFEGGAGLEADEDEVNVRLYSWDALRWEFNEMA